jgi:hypothetical protein
MMGEARSSWQILCPDTGMTPFVFSGLTCSACRPADRRRQKAAISASARTSSGRKGNHVLHKYVCPQSYRELLLWLSVQNFESVNWNSTISGGVYRRGRGHVVPVGRHSRAISWICLETHRFSFYVYKILIS